MVKFLNERIISAENFVLLKLPGKLTPKRHYNIFIPYDVNNQKLYKLIRYLRASLKFRLPMTENIQLHLLNCIKHLSVK